MQDKDYLKRCIKLAKQGGKEARPNPLVGALIVYKHRILGEGYHKEYGGPHAEVNAFNDVSNEDSQYLSESTLYVSLEPCCHYGITPPCTDLIIKKRIARVCIAELDPTDKVKSKGIQQLKENGIKVEVIPIEDSNTIVEFKVNQLKNRPYVQLKFAKSKDNFIGQSDTQVWLSNNLSSVFTHKLRAYTDGILIGTNTAIVDNPSLTLRNFPGEPPLRIVLDREGKIPMTHQLLSDKDPCIIFTENKRKLLSKIKEQIEIDFSNEYFIQNLLSKLYNLKVYHLMIEGGASLLKSFIKANLWDEAIVINTEKLLSSGIKAPNINGKIKSTLNLNGDTVYEIQNSNVK